MITLSLLKFIENNGLGVIDQDLFWQKLTLDKVGIYIADIGQTKERGGRNVVQFELYSRGNSDVDGYKRLQAILDLLNNNYVVCNLPSVQSGSGVITEGFSNVTIMPPSSISNYGLDSQGRIIYSATGTLYY
jgi:hypothetical protein